MNTLLRTRAAHADLRSGALQQLAVTDQQFVYARGAVVVAINNDTKPATLALPVSVTGRDVLERCSTPGSRTLTIPAKSSCVFAPSSR